MQGIFLKASLKKGRDEVDLLGLIKLGSIYLLELLKIRKARTYQLLGGSRVREYNQTEPDMKTNHIV